jgi:thioredoxin-like negative regulator of GroEL
MSTGSHHKRQKAATQTRNGVPTSEAKQDLATTLGQSLGSPEQKKAAILDVATALPPEQQKATAQDIASALPSEAKQDLATTLGQSLRSPEQQKATAQDIASALPSEAKQDFATTFVKSLNHPQQTQVLETVFGPLDNETGKKLLKVVIYTLTAVVFLFGAMAFMLLYQSKGAEAPLTLATTALGAIVGLIAISPGGRRSS